MKNLRNSVLVIVVLLSVSAGASKLMQLPHEVKFFRDAELSLTLLMVMGTAQWVGQNFSLAVMNFVPLEAATMKGGGQAG